MVPKNRNRNKKKCVEANKNGNAASQFLMDTAKF